MVDLPGLDSLPPAVVAWCLTAKCGYEALDRRRRGEAGTREEERARFVACVDRCVSPVDLPDTGGCDRESNDDDER